MTSSANFSSKGKYFGGKQNIPPLRFNPNPFFDVLDVVDPYGKQRSSAPRTNFEKSSLTGLVLHWGWGALNEKKNLTLFLTAPQGFSQKHAVFTQLGTLCGKNLGASSKRA